MKTIITGTQSFCKYPNLQLPKYTKNSMAAFRALDKYEEELRQLNDIITQSEFNISRVLSSSGPGLDQAVEAWASNRNVKVSRFKPVWMKDGQINKKAGFEALKEMMDEADAAIIILGKEPDKRSLSIIREMRKRGKILLVKTLAHGG